MIKIMWFWRKKKNDGRISINEKESRSEVQEIKAANPANPARPNGLFFADNVICLTSGCRKINSVATEVSKMVKTLFPESDVQYMVKPSQLNSEVSDEEALPIHFLFRKNGRPVLAVVVVTTCGYKLPRVKRTKDVCEQCGIKYQRIFADGGYADWVKSYEDDGCLLNTEKAEFFRNWFIRKVRECL